MVSSIQFLVWSTVRANLGQTWSTLSQTWSKLSELWEMYPEPRFEGFWARWAPVGSETAWSNLGQTWSNLGQTWSTLAKTGQTLGNVPQISFRGYLMRLALVGSGQLGLGCLFSRADTRENPGGKNGVMTTIFPR